MGKVEYQLFRHPIRGDFRMPITDKDNMYQDGMIEFLNRLGEMEWKAVYVTTQQPAVDFREQMKKKGWTRNYEGEMDLHLADIVVMAWRDKE